MLSPIRYMKFLSYITGDLRRSHENCNLLTVSNRMARGNWLASRFRFSCLSVWHRDPRSCDPRTQNLQCHAVPRNIDHVG